MKTTVAVMWDIICNVGDILAHESICLCGTYVTFERHICWWHKHCNSMINK